jgi:protein SCO1/2
VTSRPWLLVAVALATIGLALPVVATRGFTAFTTDTARAQDVARTPRPVPTVVLLDADSVAQPLVPRASARVRIVGFVATRCVTLCAQQNGVFQVLQRELVARGLDSEIELVTVSFDPAWDTPRALRYFAMAQRPDPRVWRVLTPADERQLPPLLDTFGIRVIREGTELVHNAALHVVSTDGRLVGIVPVDDPTAALTLARRYVPGRAGAP